MKHFFYIAQLRYLILFSCSVFFINSSTSQLLFHQDIYHGGVNVAGWSGGQGGIGNGVIYFDIPENSTIKNAWLFIYRFVDPPNTFLTINNTRFYHKEFTTLNTVSHYDVGNVTLFYKDVSDFIYPQMDSVNIEIHLHSAGSGPGSGWWCPIFYIEYEHPDLEKVATSLWYNDKDFTGIEKYTFTDMLPIDTSKDVALGLQLDRACSNTIDRTVVHLNNYLVTAGPFFSNGIGGNNANSTQTCAGVRGHFYYQNDTLFALDNSVADSIMGNNDALANIQSYLNMGDTGYELELTHVNFPHVSSTAPNIATIFPHAYSTPCDTFSTAVWFKDTTICRGDTVQIGVSGGENYTWQGVNITDSTSAIPLVYPDSTITYVVKIENDPGCYTTQHVTVNVLQPPTITNVSITPSICGDSTGHIGAQATGVSPFSSDIGAAPQNAAQFPNIPSGNYTLTITDQNGCASDTLVVVPDTIHVQTQFTPSPTSGVDPLLVNLTNHTQNATDYLWFVDDEFFSDDYHTDILLDSAGVYTLTLIAYNQFEHCADTVSYTIHVKEDVQVRIPNIFTPNNDGVNDIFSVEIKGGKHIEATITNRWGNVMHTQTQDIPSHQHQIPIWNGTTQNGKPATEGTYFYKITLTTVHGNTEVYQGALQVVR